MLVNSPVHELVDGTRSPFRPGTNIRRENPLRAGLENLLFNRDKALHLFAVGKRFQHLPTRFRILVLYITFSLSVVQKSIKLRG